MAAVQQSDILFRTGGAELIRTGAAFRRRGFNPNEPENYSFTRADTTTCATYVDQDLTIRTAAANCLRVDWTGGVPAMLIESARTNLVLQSEALTTAVTWFQIPGVGTCTVTDAAATCGIVNLSALTDSDAANANGVQQTLVFTGDAVKSMSLFVKAGTASKSRFTLLDSTAGANKLDAVISWSGTAYTTVTCTAGTCLAVVTLAGGVYRMLFQTSTITAANTHVVRIRPASDAVLVTLTGSAYFGGISASDAVFPTSYIKTAAAQITRADDTMRMPIGFPPGDYTFYAKIKRPVYANSTAFAAGGIFAVGDQALYSNTYDCAYMTVEADASGTGVGIITGANAAAIPTATTPAATSSLIEIVMHVTNHSSTPLVRLDVGAGFGAAVPSGTSPVPAVWGGFNAMVIGSLYSAAASFYLNSGICSIIVCRGAFTLAEMQAI